MFNKVILTGLVEEVEKEEGLVYFSVPSSSHVLHMEMKFSPEIVNQINESFEKGQTTISVEGVLTSDNGNLLISPVLVESYLIEKNRSSMS